MPVAVSARHALLGMLPKKGVGAETGVFRGEFSAMLIATAQPTTLHLIDPWMQARVSCQGNGPAAARDNQPRMPLRNTAAVRSAQ